MGVPYDKTKLSTVYGIFDDTRRTVYVGVTFDIDRRPYDHARTGRTGRIERLEEELPFDERYDAEARWMDKLEADGWTVTSESIMSAGRVGGSNHSSPNGGYARATAHADKLSEWGRIAAASLTPEGRKRANEALVRGAAQIVQCPYCPKQTTVGPMALHIAAHKRRGDPLSG